MKAGGVSNSHLLCVNSSNVGCVDESIKASKHVRNMGCRVKTSRAKQPLMDQTNNRVLIEKENAFAANVVHTGKVE